MPNYFSELQDGPSGPSFEVKDNEARNSLASLKSSPLLALSEWSGIDIPPSLAANSFIYDSINGNWYYISSSYSKIFKVDFNTYTLSEYPMYGYRAASFSSTYIWSDSSGKIYYSTGYIIDLKTHSVVPTKFYGPGAETYINEENIWTDGTDTYYSDGSIQFVLDESTSTWNTKTWNGLSSFTGKNIWTDGTDIYYSSGSTHYVLDKATSTWSTKTWNGLSSFSGLYIWTDGTDIYYSGGSSSTQYVLDKATSTWSAKTWNGVSNVNGGNIFKKDNNNIFLFENVSYKLNISESTWERFDFHWGVGDAKFNSQYTIWTDGTDTYYSDGDYQYVLDKGTSNWSNKTWNGLIPISGKYIWTDGTDTYYSDGSEYHYVLDKATSTWSAKTWNGLSSFDGQNIWTDGTDTYYSGGSGNQYVLDKATSTWNTKTWSGVVSPSRSNIWYGKNNVYYVSRYKPSSTTYKYNHYILDKNTGEWSSMTSLWGNPAFMASDIWNDIDGTAYRGSNYVLDEETQTWISIANNIRIADMNGSLFSAYVWNDGTNVYYSSRICQLIYLRELNIWFPKDGIWKPLIWLLSH